MADVVILGEADGSVTAPAEWRGDRFTPLVAELSALGVEAKTIAYRDDWAEPVERALAAARVALVFVDPLQGGGDRTILDDLLRRVEAAGVHVSASPATILKLGTKDVLVEAQTIGWSRGDIHRRASVGEVASAVVDACQAEQVRVLKQWRGNGGVGVFRVMAAPGTRDRFRVIEAARGSREEEWTLADLDVRLAPYFRHGGHMVDQPYYTPVRDGMVRCYLTRDRVVGFGHQYITALMPVPVGDTPPPAPSRLYHPPDLPEFQPLRKRMEAEWVPALLRRIGLTPHDLPVIWDADFLWERPPGGPEHFELCEINVSAVFPYPDSALRPMAWAASQFVSRSMRRSKPAGTRARTPL